MFLQYNQSQPFGECVEGKGTRSVIPAPWTGSHKAQVLISPHWFPAGGPRVHFNIHSALSSYRQKGGTWRLPASLSLRPPPALRASELEVGPQGWRILIWPRANPNFHRLWASARARPYVRGQAKCYIIPNLRSDTEIQSNMSTTGTWDPAVLENQKHFYDWPFVSITKVLCDIMFIYLSPVGILGFL